MKNKAEIIVIGAGVAGLTSAKLLQDSGFEVLVLEAKSYVGGRTHTIDLDGTKLDAGASWIHFYQGNPLTHIAEAYGLEVVPDSYDPFQIWDQQAGKEVGKMRDFYMAEAEKAIEAGIDFFEETTATIHSNTFFEQYATRQFWSPEQTRIIRFLYRTWVEMDYAADFGKVSLADENYIHKYDDPDETDGLIVGGYKQLINVFQTGLDIRLSTAVQTISYTGENIKISTSKGDFECQKVIITVPLGVLQKNNLDFQPELPQRKRAAIQAIGFGSLEKVILTFETAFWNNQKEFFYLDDQQDFLVFPSISNFSKIANKPTLVLFYSAQFAKKMQAQNEAAILEAALNVLQNIFQDAYRPPTQYHITRWSSDPYFGGSYSYCRDSKNAKNMDILAETIDDKVFFAGEATCKEGQGYVHGALLSGIRVAEELGTITNSILGLKPISDYS